MNIIEALDLTITSLYRKGYDHHQIGNIIRDTECVLEDLEGNQSTVLQETVKRRKMKIGGINVTIRKSGRPNPMRSRRAKLAARRHAASRRVAARKFSRSAKARQMRRVVSSMRARRSGPPRRGRRASYGFRRKRRY